MSKALAITIVALTLLGQSLSARTLKVSATGPYHSPSEAAAIAQNGDSITISNNGSPYQDAATWTQSNITIVGFGGIVTVRDVATPNGKAAWVVTGSNVTIVNIEFHFEEAIGSAGAGVYFQGTNLTLRDCYIHECLDGLFTTDNPASHIRIENCEFFYNGTEAG